MLAAVPWLNSLTGMAFMALVIVVIKTREIPNIRTAYKKTTRISGVVALKKIKGRFPKVKMAKPVIARLRIPYWSKRRPVTGDINPIKRAPGSIVSPDSKGEWPIKSCKYRGKTISTPPIERLTKDDSRVPTVKSLFKKTRRSKKGRSIVSWRWMKRAMKTSPTARAIRTLASPQPSLPAVEKP